MGGRGDDLAQAAHQRPARGAIVDPKDDVGGGKRGGARTQDSALNVVEFEKRHRRPTSLQGSCQKRVRLSSPPKSVVKIVESANRMSPARLPAGGIQRNMLISRFPASVNGCGFERSTG